MRGRFFVAVGCACVLAAVGCDVVFGLTELSVGGDAAVADGGFSEDAHHDALFDAIPDVAPDAPGDTHDAVVVGPDTFDPCATGSDPCAQIVRPNGGCYCGTNTTGGFQPGKANPNCIYRCNDTAAPTHTDGTKYCPTGCLVEPPGSMDNCVGSPIPTFNDCVP
jgi:hypothetical protein